MTSGIVISGRTQKHTALVRTVAALAAACAGVFGLLSWACDALSPSAAAVRPSTAQHGELRSIDLGTIHAGGRAEMRFEFTNNCDFAIDTADVQTSCRCLRVEFDKRRIAPHETAAATVRLDLAEELEFVGGFSPEIRFFDAQGGEQFAFVVNVSIATNDGRTPQQ